MRITQLPSRPYLGSDFACLPHEMLVEVLNHICPAKRMELRSVCRTWNFVIGNIYPLHFSVTDETWKTVVKTDAALLYVIITDLNYRIDALPIYVNFCFKILKLELTGITLYYNFLLVLQNCASLEKLSIDVIELQTQRMATRSSMGTTISDQLNQSPDELQSWMPKLKKLHIRTNEENQNNREILKFLGKLGQNRSLVTFWLTIPSNIGNFNFFPWFGNTAPSDFIYADIFRDVLASNHSTLSTAIVERQPGTGVPNNLDGAGAYDRQKCLGLWTYPRRSSESEPYLESIEGMDIFFGPNGELRSPWDQISRRCQYVRILRLAFQDAAFLLPQIQRFAAEILSPCLTQVTLQLRVVHTNGPVFNLAIFSKCTALKTLELWHHQLRYSTVIYTSGSFHWITAIDSLPATLKTFRTSFTIDSPYSSLREVPFTNFLKLETLELVATPWLILNGLPLKILGTGHLRHLKRTMLNLKTLYLRKDLLNYAMPDGTWRTRYNVSRRLDTLFDLGLTKYYASKAYYCSTINVSEYRNPDPEPSSQVLSVQNILEQPV